MKKKKETLNDLVINEAKNLKKFATKSELKKLSFSNLNPNNVYYCIYGQMTGDCTNYRANELVLKCAERVFDTGACDTDILLQAKLNGKPIIIKQGHNRLSYYISPIERFIAMEKNKYDNNKNLINFLQDKTKTLKFV